MKNLKAARIFIILSGGILLSGCEIMANGVPTVPDLIVKSQLEGSNINDAFKKYGKPQSITKTPDGQSIAKWDYIDTWNVNTSSNTLGPGPGGAVVVTPTYSSSTRSSECIMELQFNNQNIITSFKTWKSDRLACNNFYYKNK
ncbi:hypothetical protein HX779_29295 [Pseudomonas sp. A4002]|jgi:hypothetical protein|uniref:hypothetical protein n=1 Tax=unclassified Pseudomonas TaxID=196821 RepID=UPI0015A42265|nr:MULTISPECIES: hypothetical protein [unclassified Pseudomonas]NVZ36089.1 hypothetical protein [Pseudomonas sp. A4002]NWB83082.1 hypothetical protein [Pseudomonas sp. F9001]